MRRDRSCSGLGAVSVTPREPSIVVGRRYTTEITYVAGPRGVEVGGALRFKLPGLILGPDSRGPVSCSNPDVRWTCSNYLPPVNGKSGSEFFTVDYMFVVIHEAPLQEGDSITVVYGDRLALKTAAPTMAQRWPVEVAVDVDGTRAAPGSGFYLVENPPVLRFVNDNPFRMEVFVPSYTCVGEPFRTVVRMLDRYSNIVEDYTGKVGLKVHTGGEWVGLGGHTFETHHKGVRVIGDTHLDAPGVHRITAQDGALGLCARSNPTKTATQRGPVHLFWGDTHCHSSISADTSANNALTSSPAKDYEYARNRAALDFCMVTDHIEDQSEGDWAEVRQAAKDAYEPGRFVSFSAFEATFRPLRREGDKNVYFLNDDEDWVNRGTTAECYANLKQRQSEVIVIPHCHVETNWDRHDPDLERVVEVYSHWGCGLSRETDLPIVPGTERRPESYVLHALEQGAKLGFIASADHSRGHPGDDFWWGHSSYNGGLAAIYSRELTREEIWAGLFSRRCYGTTRARILLEFDINGHVMGEAYCEAAPLRELTINVYGTSAISDISVVKNRHLLKSFPGNRRVDVEISCRDDVSERETDYYYIHVRQEDGEQAWSSPIWVTRKQ